MEYKDIIDLLLTKPELANHILRMPEKLQYYIKNVYIHNNSVISYDSIFKNDFLLINNLIAANVNFVLELHPIGNFGNIAYFFKDGEFVQEKLDLAKSLDYHSKVFEHLSNIDPKSIEQYKLMSII